MANLVIVGVGLGAKDARMVEIVLARAPNKRHNFQFLDASIAHAGDIAIADTQTPGYEDRVAALKSRFPNLVVAYISDQGNVGDSVFRLARRSLLLHVLRVLDEASNAIPNAANVQAGGEPKEQVGVEPETEFASKLEAPRALIVDDSLTVRSQLSAALEKMGMQTLQAPEANAALLALTGQSIDLVLLDVMMPGMDGYALCRVIRSTPAYRSLPVIMLTSRSSPFDRARGALAGCDTYLTKPIDLASFYKAVQKQLLKAAKDNRAALEARGLKLSFV